MKRVIMIALTLLLSGRAMTLMFISRAGGTGVGDPPAAWLMPLVGDAVVGLTALVLAFLMIRQKGLWVWISILVWNIVAIWDALSAYIIHLTAPWPEFFMIQTFGASMFFMASLMHLVIIGLCLTREVKAYYIPA